MPTFLDAWLGGNGTPTGHENVSVFVERDGTRAAALPELVHAAKDHFYGLELLERIGYPIAARRLRDKLPESVRTRSGDLGEILGTEYVAQCTEFRVPLKRLRFKDDREMSMRGDDIIGISTPENGARRVLKAEVKSREVLSASVLAEAVEALGKNLGRPKPATLAFISSMLRNVGADDEAAAVEQLQDETLSDEAICHLLFTFSGNDPSSTLADHATPTSSIADLRLVGIHLPDHQAMISRVFEMLNA
jgi:hypothetical protein